MILFFFEDSTIISKLKKFLFSLFFISIFSNSFLFILVSFIFISSFKLYLIISYSSFFEYFILFSELSPIVVKLVPSELLNYFFHLLILDKIDSQDQIL